MDTKGTPSCAVLECTYSIGEKQHFFRFPKEHDKWLQWVQAWGRFDLIPNGPQYSYENFHLCHLHFEKKWYKISKIGADLHPDAVPTIFCGSDFKQEDNRTKTTEQNVSKETEDLHSSVCAEIATKVEEGNSNAEISEIIRPICRNFEIEIMKPGTSAEQPGDMTAHTTKLLDDSPETRKLHQQLKKLEAQQRTLREKIRRLRAMKAKRKQVTTSRQDAHNILREYGRKLFPEGFYTILEAQIDAQSKGKHGRRYDPEYKKFAFSIFCSSPRVYQELQKSIALPSIRTLQLITQNWDLIPGINNKLFCAIKLKLKTSSLTERHCILCADEMRLKPHLFYNISRDEVIGFENVGSRQTSIPVKRALVIMVRSIAGNWELPVYFCFMKSKCNSKFLKNVIFDIIIKLRDSGAAVHALTTDIGSNFVQLSRDLGISIQNSTFLVNEESVVYIFDTLHLIKATRNNLLKHDFQVNDKIASWADIVEFYNWNNRQLIKGAPNLSKSHIEPKNSLKKEIKYAVQIFSNSVAAHMSVLMISGTFPTKVAGTIDIIGYFNQLFDILNSSAVNSSREYGKVFVGSEKQINFLGRMLCFLESIKVVDSNNEYVQVKCFDCWQITINSVINLWQVLNNYNFSYLRTRRLNQECIDNFFNFVRQQGNKCFNPTPVQFMRAFKKFFSMKFMEYSETQNCTYDFDEASDILDALISTESTECVASSTRPVLNISTHDYRAMNLPEVNAFKYVCEYLIKKCEEMHSCDICTEFVNEIKAVLDNTKNQEVSTSGNLNITNNEFCHYIQKLEEIFVKTFKKNCFQKNIGGYLFELAQKIRFEPPCPNFPTVFLLKLYFRMRIYHTLSQYNKSCRNTSRKNRKLLNILHL